MAFCTQCGKPVGPKDVFCAYCGAQQAISSSSKEPFSSVNARTASMLCYLPWVGAIPAIVILATQRFRPDYVVRFHAFQGLYLFVAYLVADWVIKPMTRGFPGPGHHHLFGGLMSVLFLGTWIFMLIKTSQNEVFRLPILGELADRSLAEQR